MQEGRQNIERQVTDKKLSEFVPHKRSENVRRMSDERFRSLVEATSDWIWQVDQNGVYTYVSPKVKDILGYEPEEVLGKTPFDFMSKNEAIRISKIFGKYVKQKVPFQNLENWNMHKNGTLILLETSGVPIVDAKGQLRGYRGIDRDVTGRKKVEEALIKKQEELETIFDSSPMWIFYKDKENHFLRVNKAFAESMEMTKDEMEGKSNFEIFPREQAEKFWNDDKQVMASGKSKTRIIEQQLSKKGLLWVQTDKIPYRNVKGDIIGVIGFVQDITEFRKLENQLQDYAKNLENLVEERTKQLKDSERLAAIGQTAGMVGHDIRNPLQAITGDLFLIEQEFKANPYCINKEVTESIEAINENIVYINKIVSDLQDYTRAIKPTLAQISLRCLITKTLEGLRIPDKIDLRVDVKDDLTLNTDATFIKRFMGNLISNAIQAMPQGGKLTIRAYEEMNTVVLVVEDTGVGIEDKDKPNLFKPLFTTKAKGQGLGLAVAKRFVEELSGTIKFDSQVGKGTKFIVKLPLQHA
jgi:PAS domain S-box-containing protein